MKLLSDCSICDFGSSARLSVNGELFQGIDKRSDTTFCFELEMLGHIFQTFSMAIIQEVSGSQSPIL